MVLRLKKNKHADGHTWRVPNVSSICNIQKCIKAYRKKRMSQEKDKITTLRRKDPNKLQNTPFSSRGFLITGDLNAGEIRL